MNITSIISISAAALLLGACNSSLAPSAQSTANDILANTLAWGCPIIGGIQVSTLNLTATQRQIINAAAADCATPPTSLNPQVAATAIVQAAVIVQQMKH